MISLSELDTQRFGVRTARATCGSADEVARLEAFCNEHAVQLVITRCDTKDITTVHALEMHQHLLMETLPHYTFDYVKHDLPDVQSGAFTVRTLKEGEADAVKQIAQEAFADYGLGHYHADPKLDNTRCDALYADWAYNACISKQVASHVAVVESGGELIGFTALKNDKEIQLNAVRPAFQGRGVYAILLRHALAYMQGKTSTVHVSTTLNNIAVQKVWVRLGFEPLRSEYTFHKWYS